MSPSSNERARMHKFVSVSLGPGIGICAASSLGQVPSPCLVPPLMGMFADELLPGRPDQLSLPLVGGAQTGAEVCYICSERGRREQVAKGPRIRLGLAV